ncbi:Ig-like domain-containing protein [Massilia sp. BJB1822]|uniref:Ig-like domain-containing protein n=1 Tax=Massilia sp. BJB1822 TaxID=2744470 RepID=UPI001592DDF2|nr:Ig-like domain-containing protein [Massilia sp. BJB1822]NVD97745.1 DUF4214 domain-containing protein [Massilia sp. BJB1822]
MSQPNYSSANGYISESFFTIVFDALLDAVHPPLISAFDVQVNGTTVTVNSITVDSAAKTVRIGISGFLLAGDIIDFVYTDPTGGNDVSAIQGTDGADAASFSHSIIVAIGRPGPSAPPTPALAGGSDSGTVGDGITNDNTPTITGTADANATVKLYDTDGTTLLGTATADGAGNWSITSSALGDGSHTLKVTQTDSGSNTSPLSNGLAVSIDTTVAAPTALAVAASSDSGTLGDGISNVGTPQITGHAEANATVRLYDTDGTTLLGTATANGAGNWSITSSVLSEGTHTLTAKQTDVAGNVSSASSSFTYIRDTIGPTGMALSTTSVNEAGSTNGATVATLSSTDITAVTYGFAVGNGVIDADNGKFTISGTNLVAAQSLTAGTYHIYLSATDAAGNGAYQIFTITVTNVPSVSSIVRAGGAAATAAASASAVVYTVTFDQAVTGVDASDFTLTSTGNAAGTIASVTGSGATYTVTVNSISGDGTLRLDLKASGTGIQNGSAVAIGSGYTAGQTYTLDHTAPSAPSTPAMTTGTDTGSSHSDAITSNTTPTFTGTGEANASVTLYDTDGTTVLGTATADGAGNWSITSSALSAGSHMVTVKQVDTAGNVSVASAGLAVVIDTSAAAPGVPVLALGSDSGTLGDGLTNDATPTVTGTAEANALITLYDTDGTTVLGTATASNTGAWSITSSTLGEGAHTLTVKQTDPAGNVSAASSGLSLTVDITAPGAPGAPVLAAASDSGTIGDNLTNIATPVFTGTGTAGAKVNLYDTDGTTLLGTATVDGDGNWTITSSALSVGVHTLSAKQIDAAGNASSAGTPLTLTIQAPPAPTPTNIDGVDVTQQPVSLPGGGSGTQISIPIVTSGRTESSGSSGVADIPLASNGGSNLLLAQVPQGYGLTAVGGDSLPAGNSLERLIQSIIAATPGHTTADQGHLTGNGTTFLNQLSNTVPLLVQTIVPVTGGTATGALTLTGTSSNTQHTALVIDTSQSTNGSALVLNKVDFAAIVGAADVIGNTANQILTGDTAAQKFTVTSGSGSLVFAGGGNDTLAISLPATSSVSGRASASLPPETAVLHGGLGSDTATFAGAQSDYTIDNHEGYVVVTAKAQPSQHTLVINVENLKFSDATLAVQNSASLSVVSGLYQDILGRQGDHLGIEFWTNAIKNGVSAGKVALDIIRSVESQAKHPMVFNGDATHDIELLYQGIFSRHSDAGGLAFWVDAMTQGVTLEQVAQCFVTSVEMEAHKIAAQNWDFLLS